MTSVLHAQYLKVRVIKAGIEKVNLSLPAKVAGWLMEVIPNDVQDSLKAKGISIESIQSQFEDPKRLTPQLLFEINEPERQIRVWLE